MAGDQLRRDSTCFPSRDTTLQIIKIGIFLKIYNCASKVAFLKSMQSHIVTSEKLM